MKVIPYGKQDISEEDIEAVIRVLRSDFLTQGPDILSFERSFAEYIGSEFAVAVANGTAALHLCALALDVQEGDKVITSPITFVASANCIRYCGAEVVFSDIDPATYLLDIGKVRSLLESSPKGTYKGIVPVDFAGRAIDMEAYRNLADEFGLWLLEDSCHSPGGYFTDSKGKRQQCGNSKFADLAIFSFHPVKHIATGEGGMITTNDEKLYKKLLKLRSHGITRESSDFSNTKDFAAGIENASDTYPGWYMEMQTLGFNYRLSDIQAGLGLSQLKRASQRLQRRKEIALAYDTAFAGLIEKGHLSIGDPGREGHAFHLYVIQCRNRLDLYQFLKEKNIFPQVHYIPAHLMPYYRQQGWKEGDMPIAEAYYKSCLSLPMFPSIEDSELAYVIDCVKEFFLTSAQK